MIMDGTERFVPHTRQTNSVPSSGNQAARLVTLKGYQINATGATSLSGYVKIGALGGFQYALGHTNAVDADTAAATDVIKVQANELPLYVDLLDVTTGQVYAFVSVTATDDFDIDFHEVL